MSLEIKRIIRLGPDESISLVENSKTKGKFYRHRYKLSTVNGRGIQDMKDYPLSQFTDFKTFTAFIKNKPKYPTQITLKGVVK